MYVDRIEVLDAGAQKYRVYFQDWDDVRNYDLCLNTSRLSFEKCVEIIKNYIEVL